MEVMYEYFGNLKMFNADLPCSILAHNLDTRFPKFFLRENIRICLLLMLRLLHLQRQHIFLQFEIESNWYVDGAVSTNNPALIAYSEGKKLFPGEEIKVFSVGTGFNNNFVDGF